MQTFLPYPDFARSAQALDRQRLGKQRVEVWQLLRALTDPTPRRGWVNHPAAAMWRNHEGSLAQYGLVVCAEWMTRGYVDNMTARLVPYATGADSTPPSWLGDPAFHASHRSNLLRKDPAHYAQFGWTEPHDLPYTWPIGDEK